MTWALPIGANLEAEGTRFRVWASNAERVAVVCFGADGPGATYTLAPEGDGYFAGFVAGLPPGTRYMYQLDDGEPRPDPASRFQPAGVHGPSEIVDPSTYAWADTGWRGRPLEELVIYELHTGTFTPEGTFAAAITRLPYLAQLGVTAIELLPIADFPGDRNWGYDGVDLFAPSRAYGRPDDLRRLVDAAHAHGLAVILDVVYNHLGPDGNYLRLFSTDYFSDRHHTPWGDALNMDGPNSRPVRDFFINNACYWAHEFHVDGLRLDATHAILDDSAFHILAELAARVRASLPDERHFVLIAENENNDPYVILPPSQLRSQDVGEAATATIAGEEGAQSAHAWGLDAVWADDFHHQVRVALTGEQEGYYADYSGSVAELAATMQQGWFYTGQPSPRLGRPRGAPTDGIPPQRFVYCIQNHDQVGNRALGERLNHDVSLAAYRAASTLVLLCPQTPLLWMGQEWAASSPFLYFTDHNPELGRLVTEGRRAEFAGFTAFSGETVPDPQAEATFTHSRLRWEEQASEPHAGMLRLYSDLLRLRRDVLREREQAVWQVEALDERALGLRWDVPATATAYLLVVGLRDDSMLELGAHLPLRPPEGRSWSVLFDSEAARYGGQQERSIGERSLSTGLVVDGPRALLLRTT